MAPGGVGERLHEIARAQLADNAGRWDVALVFALPEGEPNPALHSRDAFVAQMLGLRGGAVNPHVQVFRSKRCQASAAELREEWTAEFGSSAAVTPGQFGRFVARSVARRIQLACGLTVGMFESLDGGSVVMGVLADEDDLRSEADRTDYALSTVNVPDLSGPDAEPARRLVQRASGHPSVPDPLLFAPDSDAHEPLRAALRRWGGYTAPYAAYRVEPEYQPFYRRYPRAHGSGETTHFRQVDRIRLVESILARNLNVDAVPALAAHFSLHDAGELRHLRDSFALRFWPPRVFVAVPAAVREYFGEKIALYFEYLHFYTLALVPIALYGLVLFAWDLSSGEETGLELVLFSSAVAVWSTVFLQLWRRRTAALCLQWGMRGFHREERPRAAFVGVVRPHPVTDLPQVQHRRRAEFLLRLSTSAGVVALMFAVLVGGVAAVMLFKTVMVGVAGSQWGAQIAGVVNALQIGAFNAAFGKVARRLTEFENHRTASDFEDQLIAKTFVLQLTSQFATLFYIAFLKGASEDGCLPGPSGEPDCLYELRTQLAAIFLTRLVVGNATEVLLPILKHRLAVWRHSGGRGSAGAGPEVDYEPLESESLLEPYEEAEAFEDMCEMVVQFAFVTLFVVAFPLVPALALANNLLEVHVDAYKLCGGAFRRPFPRATESIGMWGFFLKAMSRLAAVTNCAIIAFTSNLMDGYSMQTRFFVFVVAEHAVLLLQSAIEWAVPAEEPDVENLARRFEYTRDKLFRGLQHDDNAGFEEVPEHLSLEIHSPTAVLRGGGPAATEFEDPEVELEDGEHVELVRRAKRDV